jgi:hypothetical protein
MKKLFYPKGVLMALWASSGDWRIGVTSSETLPYAIIQAEMIFSCGFQYSSLRFCLLFKILTPSTACNLHC